jgi:hypothetical protein
MICLFLRPVEFRNENGVLESQAALDTQKPEKEKRSDVMQNATPV